MADLAASLRSMMRYALALLPLLAACATVPVAPAPPPAASWAWATFDAHGVTASGASGMADPAARRPLSIKDPVRIASISKLHVALGVMRLVEAGKLDLDADISDTLGWRLRNPAFPDTPITLRLLLSHRSSLRDDVDYAIPLGGSIQSTLAAPAAFDSEHAPGTYFRYSNLNFPVIASVMEAATGDRFDRLIARLVLKPFGLDARFNWTTCCDTAVARPPGSSTAPSARAWAISTAPTASLCRPSPPARPETTRSATASPAKAMPAKPTASAPASGSTAGPGPASPISPPA